MGQRVSGAIAAAILSAAAPGAAAPASDPICTDRPGKGTSTCATPNDRWQFETGLVDWSETSSKGTRSTSLNLFQTAIKYGLTDTMHVELDLNPYVRDTDRSATARSRSAGFGDMTVKVKRELTPKGAAFSAAIVPHLKIPSAGRRIGNGRLEGGVIVPLGLNFGKSPWSLSASPQLDAALDADRRGYHPYMAQSLSLGLQATKALSLSAELWASWDWDRVTRREASFDPGLSYNLSSEAQFDLGAAFGLNRNTADLEISGGISLRY